MIERVFLIGLRGTGKSTIAALLAQRLGWEWCDADHFLEQRHGTTIQQIFAAEGEAGFRDKESAILGELAMRSAMVIATGGGVILRPENRARLRTGATIWLTAPTDVLWQRLQNDATTATQRPDLAQGGRAEIEQLLQARQSLYQACANWSVDTSQNSPDQIADQIITWLQGQGAVDITGNDERGA